MLSKDEIQELVDAARPSMKIQNEIGFGDMNIKAPNIDIYMDKRSFYDRGKHEIHIGAMMIAEIFEPEEDAQFLTALSYIRQHEEQHVRSTIPEPYATGIRRGIEEILEYISSKEEKSRRRFRSPSDYAYFADNILPKMGIYISFNLMEKIVAGIANALEDGRIERIRSVRFPGFEKLRTLYRGKFWLKMAEDYPEFKDLDVPQKLEIITHQILTLSTTGLYAKGFATTYAGTPLMKEVNGLIPHIAKAVMAKRTRGMAAELVEICKLLAPYIYLTCKCSQTDAAAKKALEKMLADLLKSMVDAMPENTGMSEKEEDTEEDPGTSPFPNSDLTVTLDDETYDKLMEKAKKSGKKSDGGLMIQREHPKEDEKQSDNEQDGNSGSSSSSSEKQEERNKKKSDGAKNNASSQSADEQHETGEGNRNETGEDSGNETGEGSGNEGGEGQSSNDGNAKGDSLDTGNSDTAQSSTGESQKDGSPAGNSKSKPQGRDERSSKRIHGENETPTGSADLSSIEEAMKKAAEEVNEKAKREIDSINQSAAHTAKTVGKEVPNTDKPITAEDVKGICPKFQEITRKYKLTDQLPAVLMARGRSMLRKNKNYFKSLSTPNVSFLDTGSVDPGRIYGLAMGDTDIFRRRGKDKKFDGCAYILIDNSGSMSGNKRIEACKAAAVIEEGFRGLIPIKIVAFDYTGTVIHEVVKGWTEQMNKNCCWNFCLHGREGGGNADGYDIMIATKELMSRSEQHKLLLVLSDGMPAEASPGFTKGAIEAARKKGIQVSGIYFEEGRVGLDAAQFLKMYGDGTPSRDAVVCPLSELDAEVEKIMKKFSRS